MAQVDDVVHVRNNAGIVMGTIMVAYKSMCEGLSSSLIDCKRFVFAFRGNNAHITQPLGEVVLQAFAYGKLEAELWDCVLLQGYEWVQWSC